MSYGRLPLISRRHAARSLDLLYGGNQAAFYYQVIPEDGTPGTIMRATFYGSAAITIGFVPPMGAAVVDGGTPR